MSDSRILELNRKIKEAQLEIKDIQNFCAHSNMKIEFKSDCDCDNVRWFWVDVNCSDCGLRSSYDSVENKEEYSKYTRKNYENK